MSTKHPIVIVGGGPAGALAGALLSAAGREVILFDEKLAWEKPCGGGVTHKALEQYPFLADARSAGNPEGNPIEHCELISPSGQRVRFHMRHPVAIFSRRALNGLLLDRSRAAGVHVRCERVTHISGCANNWKLRTPQGEYRASYLILAAGARDPFRSQFLAPIAPSDLMVTAGYFIPGRNSLMQIQFLKEITGYIWVFPRADHVSAGIAGKMGEIPTAKLRSTLEQWLADNGFKLEGARFYSHILPSFSAQTFDTLKVCGEGWAGGWSMIGDSAGLVDPITGEGLYYALRSAELCANAILSETPEKYQELLQREVLAELKLAARASQRFYRGEIFGGSVLERIVSLTAQSATFCELMSDLFAGIQGYRGLRARMYRILPAVTAEGLAGTFRRPFRRSPSSTASDFATDALLE
jgi:flavin-dependent dehydrogenase